jgi:transposase-like protein
MSQPAFTPAQDQEVAELYRGGMSLRKIAERYSTYIQAVGHSLQRSGVARRPAGHDWRFSDAEARAIGEEYVAGASLHALKERYQCDIGTLRRSLKRVGVPMRNRGAQERELLGEQFEEVVRRWEAGESQHTIGVLLGVSQSRISRALLRAGFRSEKRPNQRERHGRWKGGRMRTMEGYVRVLVEPSDPMASMRDHAGYVPEHRLVMSRHLGRPLSSSETVHHKSGVRDDNRLENLEVRQGKHGNGQRFVCADCGSHNVVASSLATIA